MMSICTITLLLAANIANSMSLEQREKTGKLRFYLKLAPAVQVVSHKSTITSSALSKRSDDEYTNYLEQEQKRNRLEEIRKARAEKSMAVARDVAKKTVTCTFSKDEMIKYRAC
jgi:hypothetical protein